MAMSLVSNNVLEYLTYFNESVFVNYEIINIRVCAFTTLVASCNLVSSLNSWVVL